MEPQRIALDDIASVEPPPPTPEAMPHTQAYHDQRAAALLADEHAAAPSVRRIDLADIASVEPAAAAPADARSWLARGVDALAGPNRVSQWIEHQSDALADWIQPPPTSEVAPNKAAAFTAGAVQGLGRLVGSAFTPLGAAAALSGVGAERAGAAGLLTAARALRGVEAATGAAFAGRGLEQVADAPDLAGKAMGVAQAAAGALGVHGGVQGILRGSLRLAPPPPAASPPVMRGMLRSAPGFVADASGTVAPFGTDIPMTQAPDGSYVRAVPGTYAQREVRGLLNPVRGYVADATGNVVPTEHAASLPAAAAAGQRIALADISHVESVPAAPLAYEFQQQPPGTRPAWRLTPTQYSGDVHAEAAPHVQLSPADVHALNWIKADLENLPFVKHTFNETTGRGGDFDIVSGAAGAPIYQTIIGDVSKAGRGDVLQAVDNLLAGKLTPLGQHTLSVARALAAGDPSVLSQMTLPPETGGDVTGTYAGRGSGPVYRTLAEDDARPAADTAPLGVRDFAQALANEGEKPIADVPFSLSGGVSQMDQPSARRFAFGAPDSNPLDAFDTSGHTYSGREPGEEGAINPVLAARIGLGGAGAAYGAATGDTPADRITRALLFGGAGALAPSLFEAGGGALAGAAGRGDASGETTAGEPSRTFTPHVGAMPDSAIPSARPMPEAQQFGAAWLGKYSPELRAPIGHTFAEYDGFEAQRRFVQPDVRVEALAQQIAVDMSPHRPGAIVNVEESRAMANATATLFDRVKAVRAEMASGQGDPAVQTAVLAKLYQDGTVLLGNVRANASEQGRALRGQQIINAALSSYDERILAEAAKRLGPQLKLFTEQLAQLPDDPGALYNLLREHVQAGRGPTDQLFAYLYNNVLSGPSTFLKNVLGTGTNQVFQAGANVVAGVLEARKPLADRSVLLGEGQAALPAMASGLFQGGKAAAFILQHGYDPLAIARGEIPAIFTETPGGAATNWPTRLTRAVHGVLFSEGARAYEATSIAYTQAAKEAAAGTLTGPALTDFLAQRTAALALSPDVQAQASQYAARSTFQNEPGPTLRAFGNLLNSNRALKFLQMFWKITGNIAVQQMRDNTPAAFIPALGDSGVSAGGRVGAQAQARAILGTALLAPLAAAVGAGLATGNGPTDPKRRPLWLATHQPNAIRIGDHWVDYRALPVAMPLSVIANLYEGYQEGEASHADTSQFLSAFASRAGNVLTSQPFLAGITSFIHAMEKPAEQGSQLLKSTAQAVVPFSGMLRNVTRAVDPTIRDVHTPLEAVQEITPGWSTALPPRLNLWGQPQQRPGGPLTRMFAPSVPEPMNADPLVNYLERIQAPMRADRRETNLTIAPGLTMGIPPSVDFERRAQGGQVLRTMLTQLTANPRFQVLPVDEQQQLVEEFTREARGGVQQQTDAYLRAQAAINPRLLRGAVIERLKAAGRP